MLKTQSWTRIACGFGAMLMLGACDPMGDEPVEVLEDRGGSGLIDGTPDAIGLLALVNHPSTTFDILDDDVPLDSRAAESLTEYRAGPV